MHYYRFNIGDYRRDTAHLSLLEHGIYRQLIDSYYLSEKPLSLDISSLMRTHCVRNADEKDALEYILKTFFVQREEGYFHVGCEKVLHEYKVKSDKARSSAMARWSHSDANALQTQSERNANGMLTNNHKPLTNNHKPINKKTTRTANAVACPVDVDKQVWDDFMKIRKAKRSPITETALQRIRLEAEKAGWSLGQAIAECVARGWQGFNADWVASKPNATLNKQEALEARNQAVVERLLAKEAAIGG